MKPAGSIVLGLAVVLGCANCATPRRPEAPGPAPRPGKAAVGEDAIRLERIGTAPSPAPSGPASGAGELAGACRLPSGAEVSWSRPAITASEVTIRIRNGDQAVSIVPQPRVDIEDLHGTTGMFVACDPGIDRVYFAHPLLGYVSAWRADGVELWHVELSGFVRLSADEYRKRERDALTRSIFDGELSVVTELDVDSAGHLLVETKRWPAEMIQHLFHRSGRLLGRQGPWDGYVQQADPDARGWVIYAGGMRENYDLFLPTEAWRLEVDSPRTDLLVDHFVAWFLPDPGDGSFVHRRCRYKPATDVHKWLRERFDPEVAAATKALHDELGPEWLERRLDYAPLARLVSGPLEVLDPAWRERFRRALVEAGADVEVAARLAAGADPAGGGGRSVAPR